jgi:hypothetical protein
MQKTRGQDVDPIKNYSQKMFLGISQKTFLGIFTF